MARFRLNMEGFSVIGVIIVELLFMEWDIEIENGGVKNEEEEDVVKKISTKDTKSGN